MPFTLQLALTFTLVPGNFDSATSPHILLLDHESVEIASLKKFVEFLRLHRASLCFNYVAMDLLVILARCSIEGLSGS